MNITNMPYYQANLYHKVTIVSSSRFYILTFMIFPPLILKQCSYFSSRWSFWDFCQPPYTTAWFKPTLSCTRLKPLKNALPTALQRRSLIFKITFYVMRLVRQFWDNIIFPNFCFYWPLGNDATAFMVSRNILIQSNIRDKLKLSLWPSSDI